MRIGDADSAALDTQDAVGLIAELKNISRQAFDGEIFVHAADELIIRLEQNPVIRVVRDRATWRSAPSSVPHAGRATMVDGVMMDQGAPAAPPCGEAFGEHCYDAGKIGFGQIAIGPGAPQQGKKFVLVPVTRRHFGGDLLGQHIERLILDGKPVKFAAPDAVEQCRAFGEIIAREGKQAAFGQAIDGMSRASDPLQKTCDRTRRSELAHQIDIADVDAKFEGSGRDKRFELALFQTMLGVAPMLLRHAAMMGGDPVGAEALR